MTLARRIKKIVKWCLPFGLVEYRRAVLQKKDESFNKQNKIKRYFLGLDKSRQDREVAQIIEYFEYGFPFSVFPYSFRSRHNVNAIGVFYDEACKMRYVLHDGKRMYFPQTWDEERVRGYYNGLLIEQDIDSPHRYETEEFCVQNGDVIADIGAAEGIWALTCVEKAGKIYLFECESQWTAALKKTFEPWKEKVVLVNKYVSNVTRDNLITLDDFLGGETINFIKADIEGSEVPLLEGAGNVLSKQQKLKLLLCAYHRKDDARILKKRLEQNGFRTEYSKGYMLFIYDPSLAEPYIRRGLIRAVKE
jgi:hypothetical protein